MEKLNQIVSTLVDEEIITCVKEINEDRIWRNGMVNEESLIVKISKLISPDRYTSQLKICSVRILQEAANRWIKEKS